jgi:hypothetical protein
MTNSPPIAAYYQSPWNYDLLIIVSIIVGVFIYAVIRSEHLQQKNGRAGYTFLLLCLLGFIGVGVYLMGSRVTRQSPWLAIYKDHLTCGSWIRDGRFTRAPWNAFTNVTKVEWPEARFRRPFEVNLRFAFKPEFAGALQTTDYVRQLGWFYCQIDGLTKAEHRFGLPASTDEIYRKVREVFDLNLTVQMWEEHCKMPTSQQQPWCSK